MVYTVSDGSFLTPFKYLTGMLMGMAVNTQLCRWRSSPYPDYWLIWINHCFPRLDRALHDINNSPIGRGHKINLGATKGI